MDIYCPKCGEPWEIDSLHERINELNSQFGENIPWVIDGKYNQEIYEEKYFNPILKRFRFVGCEVFDAPHGEINKKNAIYGQLMDFAGDDVDFASEMMNEAESWGLLD
jgi:hypothetical protein